MPTLQIFGRILCIGIVAKYRVRIVYLIKMKVLPYTSYKEHCELYTEIHRSIAVSSCQIGLFKKDKILLTDNKLFKYSYSKASSSGVCELDDYIEFTLSQGTYSIDEFNKKIRAAFLQQKQNWNVPHIKNLKLVVPEDYAFIAHNNFFTEIGMPEKILKNINIKYSLLFSGSYKTQLVTTPPQNHYHSTVIKPIKLRTSQTVNHHICWLVCKFMIMRQPFPQSIQHYQSQTHIAIIWILKYLMKTTTKLSRGHSISNY